MNTNKYKINHDEEGDFTQCCKPAKYVFVPVIVYIFPNLDVISFNKCIRSPKQPKWAKIGQKFTLSLLKKLQRHEKSALPKVVAVGTNMSYASNERRGSEMNLIKMNYEELKQKDTMTESHNDRNTVRQKDKNTKRQ